ncbi:LysR family transcriptional regulator [Halofilum ochraceum]|uniref:LysR family transcriptional regulator n=1 Tax=Halofilum ochraceum TaxID=1611323 RepID=UPI0008301258|nr:LysR family transcriptional regulator [Halofilum ochraceum]
MREINYKHLHHFWAVAHEGGLSRAAERLHLSQSVLSVQIRKLEERLGHALFERRGRRLHLTEAGRIALDHADAIFAAGDELVATLAQSDGVRRALRIGALSTLSRNFQIGFLRPVLGRSDVEVILRSGGAGELMQALESLQLDVVLVNQAPQADAVTPFVTHRVAEQPLSLVGTADTVTPGMDIAELLRAHAVILPTPENNLRVAFDALVDRLGIRPRIAAEIDDMAMIRLMAREGLGLALVPPIVIKDELASGMLVEAARVPDVTETFYAVTVARRFPNPLVRELLAGANPDSLKDSSGDRDRATR